MPVPCPCGSSKPYADCCEPYIKGKENAPTAEALMRSRYSAYRVHDAEYLYNTSAPEMHRHLTKASILNWAQSNHWIKLEIIMATAYVVEFKAYYLDSKLQAQVHHEVSSFTHQNGQWYYQDGSYK
jgi:SEC-C motif-containing protein